MNIVPYNRRGFGSSMGSPYMNEMPLSLHEGSSYGGYNSYGGNMYGDNMYGGAGHGFYRSPHLPPPGGRYMREPYIGGAYGGHYDDRYDDALYPGRFRDPYIVSGYNHISPYPYSGRRRGYRRRDPYFCAIL